MGGLMGLHIWGYVVFVLGWTQEWIVSGFWLGMIIILGLVWRWTEKTFLSLEAPAS
jgi:hypothetical protein